MACIITYENKQYTQKEFEQYFKEHFTEFVGEFINTKPDVILPIGTSGSGKSTFIKSLPQENLVVIEPDAMRVEFTGDINDKSKDKEIYIEAAKRAIKAIKQGKQVIFDTTNLTKDKRLPFIEAIKKAIPTANIQYKLMELNPELAKQRIKSQLERGENRAAVSDETIDRHAASYKQMLEDIKDEPITKYKELGSKQDIEGFKEFVQEEKEDLKPFIEESNKIEDKSVNERLRKYEESIKIPNNVKSKVLEKIEKETEKVKEKLLSLGLKQENNKFELITNSYATFKTKLKELENVNAIISSNKTSDFYQIIVRLKNVDSTIELKKQGELPFTFMEVKQVIQEQQFLNDVADNVFEGLSEEEKQILKKKIENGDYDLNCKI